MNSKVDLIIFGGTGDLSTRKLLPALFQLHRHQLAGRLHRIVATGRSDIGTVGFRSRTLENLKTYLPADDWDDEIWQQFSDSLHYAKLDAGEEPDYRALGEFLDSSAAPVRIFYLATLPSLYGTICQQLKHCNVSTNQSRVVLEKPLGHDLKSCREINEQVATVFSEEATFRIDHYLGKETVQNLIAIRFGNPLFHPLWNNAFVDNVQITVAEEVGVGGRGSYYADIGALRDMVQNHLLQVLTIVAMEPPASLTPSNIRDEKVKVLRSLELIDASNVRDRTVRGRYAAGAVQGEVVPGFLDEDKYADADTTETYVAVKAGIANWRWAGVPFYLRTGKRLARRYSEVVIEFKRPAFSLFANDPNELTNKLVIRLQPEETITLHTLNKKPGLGKGLSLKPVELHLTDDSADDKVSHEAYERLLLDAIHGDQTLFMRRDEVEAAWLWTDSIIEAWQETATPIKPYNAGTMGPGAATALTAVDGRSWYE